MRVKGLGEGRRTTLLLEVEAIVVADGQQGRADRGCGACEEQARTTLAVRKAKRGRRLADDEYNRATESYTRRAGCLLRSSGSKGGRWWKFGRRRWGLRGQVAGRFPRAGCRQKLFLQRPPSISTETMDRSSMDALLDWMKTAGARWAGGLEVRHGASTASCFCRLRAQG